MYNITDLKKTDRAGYTIVKLTGNLSLSGAAKLKEIVRQYLKKPTLGIILNFEEVSVVDSSGVSIIVAIHKQLNKLSSYLALTQVNNQNLELFTLTKLDRILILAQDDDDAITLLQFLRSRRQVS